MYITADLARTITNHDREQVEGLEELINAKIYENSMRRKNVVTIWKSSVHKEFGTGGSKETWNMIKHKYSKRGFYVQLNQNCTRFSW